MARRREFVRGAAAIRQRRLTTWFQFAPVETTLTSSGAAAIVFSLNAAALALRPFTFVRTRFELKLRSDQAAAIENQTMGVGLAIVTDQAAAVGITAVPTPLTDLGSNEWMALQILYGDESNLTDRTRGATNATMDSKAMRKVEVGQDLVVVMENGSGQGIIGSVGGRMLIKNN